MVRMTDRPTEPTADRQSTDRATASAAVGRPTTRATDRPTDARHAPSDPAASDRRPVDETEPWPLRVGLTGALWTLSTVGSLMAANGQLGFATWAGVHGLARYGVPIILDVFSVVLLLLGYRQGRRRRSPWPLWLLGMGVAGFSIYTNVVHAGDRAGLVYGAASAASLIAWLVKLWVDLKHYLERIGHIPPGRPKFGKLALVAPRVALHCWTITVRRRVVDGDLAVTCAETWIVVRDDTYAKLRELGMKWGPARRLAVRTAWRQVFEMTGGPTIAIPRAATVETVTVTMATADQSATPRPTDHTSTVAAPTVDPVSTAPTDRARTDRPATDRRPTAATRRPRATAGPAQTTGDRSIDPDTGRPWPGAVLANARLLRETHYPDGLPHHYSYGQVRSDTGWSFDRAKAAVNAYRVGADIDEDLERSLAETEVAS